MLLAVLLNVSANAQSVTETPAVPFLEIDTDARAAGLGGIPGLFDANAYGIFSHPAFALFSSQHFGLGTTLSARKNLKDGNLYTLGSYYNLNKNNGLAIGVRYFSHPQVQAQYKPTEAAIDLAYSRRITEQLSLSATLRYIYSDLGDSQDFGKGSGVGADVGIVYNNIFSQVERIRWSTGIVASNFGSKMYYGAERYTMPFSVRWANTLHLPISENHVFNLVLNAGYRILPVGFSAFEGNVGLEYNLYGYGALRAGYHIGHPEKGLGNFFSLGAGVTFSRLKMDVAYRMGTTDESFKNILFLSLGVFF